jgi:hypothetical protein
VCPQPTILTPILISTNTIQLKSIIFSKKRYQEYYTGH